MAGIKLVPGRMAQLRQTLNTEQARLQDTADQLARIAAALDMDLKARQSIDSGLTRLRSDLKRQAGNLGTMVGLAQTAEAGLGQTDQELANKASELLYTLRQMMQSAGAAGGAGGVGYSPSRPSFTLGSLLDSSAFQNVTDLFGFTLVNYDPIGVSLQELSGKIRDSLSALASPTGLATAAGAGVALAGTGLGSLLGALDGGGKVLGASSQKSTAKKTSTSKKKKKETWQDKLKGLGSSLAGAASDAWEDAKDAASDAWEDAKDAASDAWEDVKDTASDAWEGVKDAASDTWEGAKDLADKAAELGGDVWGKVKDIANSKPMEYVWEMGGSTLGGLGDVFSFCVNVGKGNFTGAAADTYSFVDNFFDFSQDLSALGAYGLGAGFEALGIGGDDVMDRAIEMADEISGRDGLKGELEASGFGTAADIVGGVDATVGTYKFVTGISGLKDGVSGIFTAKDHSAELKKVLFEASGWKLPSAVTGSNAVLQDIGKSGAVISNVNMAYKYLDGFLNDSGLEAILGNTKPGKIITGPEKILESLTDEKVSLPGSDQYNDQDGDV